MLSNPCHIWLRCVGVLCVLIGYSFGTARADNETFTAQAFHSWDAEFFKGKIFWVIPYDEELLDDPDNIEFRHYWEQVCRHLEAQGLVRGYDMEVERPDLIVYLAYGVTVDFGFGWEVPVWEMKGAAPKEERRSGTSSYHGMTPSRWRTVHKHQSTYPGANYGAAAFISITYWDWETAPKRVWDGEIELLGLSRIKPRLSEMAPLLIDALFENFPAESGRVYRWKLSSKPDRKARR